jgi:hypothetical protein
MTARRSPRVVLWLLERFGPDNEPLAGDLIEQFEMSNSRWWLWRQVLAAVVLAHFDRPREVRPLRLIDREPGAAFVAPPAIDHRPINLSASPLPGVGGLSLLVFGALVSIVAPQTWWVVLAAVLGGILLGVLRISLKRPRAHAGYADLLFEGGGERRDPAHQPTRRG